MWRWLSGLPRAIRQQVHGPRTATGVCVEEETELEQKYKKVQRHRCKNDRTTYGQYNTCSSGYHDQEGSKHGPDQEKCSQNYTKDFFSFFQGTHSLEALGWGAAVVLGIHLSKCPVKSRYEDRHKRRTSVEAQNKCLLYHIASAIPDKVKGRSLAQSIVGSDIGVTRTTKTEYDCEKEENDGFYKGHTEEWSRSHQSRRPENLIFSAPREETENVDPLHKVMNEFEGMCRKYTGIGKNIQGLQASAKNQMKKALSSFIDASHLGYTKAQFNLGLCYETGRGVKVDLRKAEKYYKLAADDGHPQAMYNLALMYLKGEGGIQKDVMLALDLLHKAAESGLCQAQTYLGVYYTEEESQDIEKAVSFFQSAAQQNDAEAQYFLGICYENGWGVEVNQCKSAELYSQAASNGHDGAMYNMGVYHELAMGGLPEDKVSAAQFYQKAAAAGNEQAMFQLTRLKADSLREELNLPPLDELQNKPLSEGKEDESLNHRGRQPLKLNVSVSSPSLTEYVRNHLSAFISSTTTVPHSIQDPLTLLKNHLQSLPSVAGNMYNEEIIQMKELPPLTNPMADWKPQYGSPRRSDYPGNRVSFTLGGDDDESLLTVDEDFSSSTDIFSENYQFYSSIPKNSTMPNLHCVSCN